MKPSRPDAFRVRAVDRAKVTPVDSVQIAEALLELEGAPRLAALFSSGRKCDEVPVKFVMLRMFPVASDEELTEGLQLALSIARLDTAEFPADWRPSR